MPWHRAGQRPGPPGFFEGVKKEVALRLWHEKSLVLHKLCTLRCSSRLPKFPPQFRMEVKLLLAVKTRGGEGIILHSNVFFLKQVIWPSNCNLQVSNCSPNCPLACTMKEINTFNFFFLQENICDPLTSDPGLRSQLWSQAWGTARANRSFTSLGVWHCCSLIFYQHVYFCYSSTSGLQKRATAIFYCV